LDLSKFDAGKLELHTSSVNITELIRGLVGTFSSLAESKKIILTLEIEEGILGIVDKHKLETILINLLSNAFKYTPDGGGIIVSANGYDGSLKIKVNDNGPGIPEEKREKIFERFYQVDDAEARKNKGTGIGLSFTNELVKMHGGNLELSGKEGEGCTFSFTISYYPENYLGEFDETEHAIPNNSDASIKEILNESVLSDLPLILIVEDNADVRNYIHSILTDTCQVVFAINGLEGRDKAFDIVPDLIISDVMMPIMDGFEFCAAVKSDIRTAHIPVILLTAKSSSENRIKGLEQEADIFMSKPFNPLELELQVRNLLNLQERQRDRYKTSNELTIPLSIDCNSMEQKFLSKLEEVMASNYKDQEFTSELLGSELAISRSQLHRKLKAISGESASKFIRIYRLKIAYKLISDQTGSISQIAYEVGFNNVSYFNKCFKETFGIQPSELIA
jgi:DNA-binding response OmpR family regulator